MRASDEEAPMPTEAPLDGVVWKRRTTPEPSELAEKRAAEAMAEKLRREADRFLHARPRAEAEERTGR